MFEYALLCVVHCYLRYIKSYIFCVLIKKTTSIYNWITYFKNDLIFVSYRWLIIRISTWLFIFLPYLSYVWWHKETRTLTMSYFYLIRLFTVIHGRITRYYSDHEWKKGQFKKVTEIKLILTVNWVFITI